MNPKNFHISRRAFLGTTAAASVAGMLGGMPIRAFGKDQVKLSFMYPVGVSGDINRIVSGMIAAFNAAHADVQVEAIYAGSYDNTEQKVMTSLGVGDPPGTWLPINSALQTFLAMGALEDITALAKADDIYQDFLPGFLGTCISDDKLYGLFVLIAQQHVGARPGRIEPRALKRRHKPYPMLTKPRTIMREYLREHGHPKKLK